MFARLSINSHQIHFLQTSERQQPDGRATAQDFYPDEERADDRSPLRRDGMFSAA